MKKLILFVVVVFALFIIACGNNGVSTETEYNQPETYSSSSIQQPETYSSSSIQQTQTYSSSSIQQTQTYSSSSRTSYWSLEIGNVCNGYNIDVAINDKSKPVEGYAALNTICGNRANFTYECEPIEQSVKHIMTFLSKETALQVIELAENYGAAFGFYNAADGYLRYIYFEQCYDGIALLKRQ